MTVWKKLKSHTQYKCNYEAGDLTHAQHEEEHDEDGPGRGKGHGTAEDTNNGNGTEQYRLPAKPDIQIQQWL